MKTKTRRRTSTERVAEFYGLTPVRTEELARHIERHWRIAGREIDRDNTLAPGYLAGVCEDIMKLTGFDGHTAIRFVGNITGLRSPKGVWCINLAEKYATDD